MGLHDDEFVRLMALRMWRKVAEVFMGLYNEEFVRLMVSRTWTKVAEVFVR